jgi:hypothetical protein
MMSTDSPEFWDERWTDAEAIGFGSNEIIAEHVTSLECQYGRYRIAKSIGIIAGSAYSMTMVYLAIWWFAVSHD